MEENISYRRLKNKKLSKVQGISKRLLKLPMNRLTSNSAHKDFYITNKNVSMYEYMLVNSYIKQNYINWAINLRSHPVKNSGSVADRNQSESEPPQVFFKKTKVGEIRQASKQKVKALNTSEFSQYFTRSQSSKNFGQSSKEQLDYLNNLRNYGNYQTLKPRFNNDASKSSQLKSEFLKQSAIKKTQNIDSNDKQNALDGTHQFPGYNYDGLRDKNISMLNSLVKKGDKVSLPTIEWSVGLRNYSKNQ